MKKSLRALALTLLLVISSVLPAMAAHLTDAEAMRGVWVSSVYNLDYPSKQTTDADDLRDEADLILNDCKKWNINTVFLQVRPTSDALYDSDIFPWSHWLTGTQGTAPEDNFDPLAYWVEAAHKRGIELHAWINPYRITRAGASEISGLSPENPAVQHPEWTVTYENNLYYNPALPEVQQRVIDGVQEIIDRYDVDGIHMDDYFYPGTDFNDSAAYQGSGSSLSLADWRRSNVNNLVESLSKLLRKENVTFGISPSGVWANRTSDSRGSDTRGYEHYCSNYADSLRWIDENWIDYIIPQIYWEIGHPTADFATLATWWQNAVKDSDVKLYIGMAAYRIADSGTGIWETEGPLLAAMDYLAAYDISDGCVFFRMGSLQAGGLGDRIAAWYAQPHEIGSAIPPHGEGSSNTVRTFGDIFAALIRALTR